MVNFFSGLEDFIAKWDGYVAYTPLMDKDLPFVKGEQGAINLDGDLSCFEASIFSRASLLFEEVIEDGVKSLVLFLVDSMQCITYTSCQGHIVDSECISLRYRSVGLLPRNEKEYQVLIKKLNRVDNHVNETTVDSFVKVVVEESFVDSETLRLPCIDILFLPKEGYEEQYFTDLEKTYQSFLESIKQEFQDWSTKIHA